MSDSDSESRTSSAMFSEGVPSSPEASSLDGEQSPSNHSDSSNGYEHDEAIEDQTQLDGEAISTYLHNPLHNVLSSIEYMPCLLASIA
jgi:hypothetical protein